jgi:hypothetical protein
MPIYRQFSWTYSFIENQISFTSCLLVENVLALVARREAER